MRFLADENFPKPGLDLLRAAGFEVAAVIEEAPGSTDLEVLARSRDERRVLPTFDRDFGELIFRDGYAAHGVIYLRFTPSSRSEAADLLGVVLVEPGLAFEGLYTIVHRDRHRQRPLP